jgi:hypothetical protein
MLRQSFFIFQDFASNAAESLVIGPNELAKKTACMTGMINVLRILQLLFSGRPVKLCKSSRTNLRAVFPLEKTCGFAAFSQQSKFVMRNPYVNPREGLRRHITT